MTTMREETAGQMLERLGADGMKWAEEFRLMAIKLGYSDMPADWLVGWFANAIEYGHMVKSKAEENAHLADGGKVPLKRYEWAMTETDIPYMKEKEDGRFVMFDDVQAMLSQRGEVES